MKIPPIMPNSNKIANQNNSWIPWLKKSQMEVPTEFLNTIREEKHENKQPATSSIEPQITKKYPFNRTTTPNSLREHLKETLTKNLGGSASDIAETIEHIKNDEIFDTFNIDNENVESPPVQRKAFRQRSMRLPPSNLTESNDNLSDAGSDFVSRRRNLKFRTLGSTDGHGNKPLGDREMMLKKKKEQQQQNNNTNLTENNKNQTGIGNGIQTGSGNSPTDDMGNGLFDRFSNARKTIGRNSIKKTKNDDDTKSLNELSFEKKSSITSDWKTRLANKFKKSSVDSYDVTGIESGEPSLKTYRKTSDELSIPMTEPTRRKERKTSYAAGDYDSELVDGKYVTSVPIVNPEDEAEEAGNDADGNLRPSHRQPPRGLRDLKSATNSPADDLMKRLQKGTASSDRKAASQSSVFDRLSTNDNAASSKPNGSSRRSYANQDFNGSIRAGSKTSALTKIKDLTNNLRKNSREEEMENKTTPTTTAAVAPRNSLNMFTLAAERKPMSNLNNSKTSINSSTRSLQKDSPKTARRATTSTLDNARSTRTTTSKYNGSSTTNLRNGTSKENLSGSSSSVSNSQQDLSNSKNGIMKPGISNPNMRSSPMRITSGVTLTPSSPVKARRTTPSANLSFMKPTTSSAKKLSNVTSTTISSNGNSNTNNSNGKKVTSTTTTRLSATRPSRR